MLKRVEVRHFQSLRAADIPLGRFTVITGPTGSGKSALFRALRALACNARGTAYISAGQKSCTVSAGGDGWVARLARSSAARGKNEYRTAQLGDAGWVTKPYTKLGGQVPAPVAELLGLTDLNFARQFDPPFLLSDSGAEIARRLGDLTNVSLVLGAAAEAGRRRKQLARDLEGAQGRRDALMAEAQEFAGLKDRLSAATAAEEALARAQVTSASMARLDALQGRLAAAENVLLLAQAQDARQAPPSLARLEELAAQAARLRALAGSLQSAENEAARLAREAEAAGLAEQAAHTAVHDALVTVGQCPTCLQTVT
jgi:DNA repair exonuclease SbcCD ATPase subunit